MFCTNCGAKLEDGANFCTSCGARVEEAAPAQAANVTDIPAVETSAPSPVVNTPVTDAPPAENPEQAPVSETPVIEADAPSAETPAQKTDAVADLLAKGKALWATALSYVKPLIKKADDKAGQLLGNKKMYAYIGALALVGIIIVVCAVVGMIPESNGYLAFESSHLEVYGDDQLYSFSGGKKTEIKADVDIAISESYSIDGKAVAFQDDSGDLYMIKGKKAVLVAEDVFEYALSIYGDSLVCGSGDAFVSRSYYYCRPGKDPVEIFENNADEFLTSYAISPDGKSVVYNTTDGDLYYFNGKKSEKICEFNGTVISTSNGGKYIYAHYLDDISVALYCINKKGDAEEISSGVSSEFHLNLDCTEIMFYHDGRTYISTKGKEPVKVASAEVSLLLPRYTTSITTGSLRSFSIHPVESLYDHAYYGGYNLYYISRKESKNTKLASSYGGVFLDDSAEYIYYMDDDYLMCLEIADGSNAKNKAKEIAEDVDMYVVSSDRKYVYYISDDSVCVVNGKKGGKPKTLSSDDVEFKITITRDDTVYYISDDFLYGIKGRSKGKKIMADAYFENLGGYLYISEGDSIYAARGTSKPKKLIDSIY